VNIRRKTSRRSSSTRPATAEFEALSKVVDELERAARALSETEREAYRQAQQSVVDARRKAETEEGLLQVN
jgi:hypothetical protein